MSTRPFLSSSSADRLGFLPRVTTPTKQSSTDTSEHYQTHESSVGLGEPGVFELTICLQLAFSARPLTEVSQEGGSISTEVGSELDTSHVIPFHVPFCTTRPPDTNRVVPSQLHLPQDIPVPEERSYDRPGKKRAVQFQPNPLKLVEYCRRAGG